MFGYVGGRTVKIVGTRRAPWSDIRREEPYVLLQCNRVGASRAWEWQTCEDRLTHRSREPKEADSACYRNGDCDSEQGTSELAQEAHVFVTALHAFGLHAG